MVPSSKIGAHFNNNKLQNDEVDENQPNAELVKTKSNLSDSWTDGEFEPIDDSVTSKYFIRDLTSF